MRRPSKRAQRARPHYLRIEVEVESADDLREAIEAGADIIMLDNQTSSRCAPWCGLARDLRPEVILEASGGVTLENVRAVAETGVDIVSTSALTMGAPPANLSLTLLPPELIARLMPRGAELTRGGARCF